MALDDVRHVEAIALMQRMLDDAGDRIPYRAVVEGWLEENHPGPDAYVAALHHLASGDGEPRELTAAEHAELVPRGFQ